MDNLVSLDSVSSADGMMHVVELPGNCGSMEWLLNTQVELDGKRVFVRAINTNLGPAPHADKTLVGMVVSSIY